jgi:hypothetical protein
MKKRFGGGLSFSAPISMRERGVWQPRRKLKRLGSGESPWWRVRQDILASPSAEASKSSRQRLNRPPRAAEFGDREGDAKGRWIPI